MISQPLLWQRIARHPIGGDRQQSLLLRKLAAEQGWPDGLCRQALAEYRRFVYLTCVSSTPLTPSLAVDAVWHLHLTFSHDYWEVFCPQVLGRALHHEPDETGDQPRLRSQYLATLAHYQAEFAALPPQDVWGPMPAPPSRRRAIALAAAGVPVTGGAALAAQEGSGGGYDGLIAFAAFAVVVLLIYRVLRPERPARRRDKRPPGSGCSSSCGSSCTGVGCGSSCGGGGD